MRYRLTLTVATDAYKKPGQRVDSYIKVLFKPQQTSAKDTASAKDTTSNTNNAPPGGDALSATICILLHANGMRCAHAAP